MATSNRRLAPRSPYQYQVLWICALPEIELEPAKLMLDHEHEPPPVSQWLNEYDENWYAYGDVNGHNVVIACMPLNQPGRVSAQLMVTPVPRSFPNVRISLFVGIGGGVPRNPSPPDATKDIRLGDVVIGWGDEPGHPAVIVYDYVRFRGRGGVDRDLLGQVDAPNRVLIQHLTPFILDPVLGDRAGFNENLERLKHKPEYQHPGLDNDILYAANYEHQTAVLEENHSACATCDNSQREVRPPRLTTKAMFHRGTILSGDSVMMSASDRDTLSLKYNGKVFEMEAAGVMATTHPLVIRGVSDYSDSHKSPRFKKYAAATAAAFARELLCEIRATAINDLRANQYPMASWSDSQRGSGLQAQGTVQGIHDDSDRRRLEEAQWTTADHEYATVLTTINRLYESANDLWRTRHPPNNNILGTLQQVLGLLERARDLLERPGIPYRNLRGKVFFRLIQAERDITFKCKRQEQDHHIYLAFAYGEEALKAAKATQKPGLIAHVQLEIAFSRGREALLLVERLGRDDRGVRNASLQQIKAALDKMRDVGHEKYEFNRKHAQTYWIPRLSANI
ncbi:MAG: hypothetical protein Q9168_006692 [Polycauliona sp. 1 TL-2023]